MVTRQVGLFSFPNVRISTMIAVIRTIRMGGAEDVATRFFPRCPAIVALHPLPSRNRQSRHNKTRMRIRVTVAVVRRVFSSFHGFRRLASLGRSAYEKSSRCRMSKSFRSESQLHFSQIIRPFTRRTIRERLQFGHGKPA